MTADETESVPRYEIRHVKDFLNVPEERREACLEEFKTWIALSEGFRELFGAVAEAAGIESAIQACAFIWIDDGQNNVEIQLETDTPNPATMP